MEHDGPAVTHRQSLGVLLALVTLMAGPLGLPAATAATPLSAASGIAASPVTASAETPSEAALRTSSTLAATAVGALVLVVVFWYLVVRSRRK